MAGSHEGGETVLSAPLRVVDVGTQVAGPFAATLLGDFGAEVIKCEQPGTGDPLRHPDGMSSRWLVDGRNKRSITLNLRTPEGQALVRRLAEWADVLVENFRPGTMARWNLGYDTLAQLNPRLVYVSVSGFGQTGPYATRPAYHSIGAAFGGLSALTGYASEPPATPGPFLTDYIAGLFGALGALEAVRRRDAGGSEAGGEWVDAALSTSALRLVGAEITDYLRTGVVRTRNEAPPYQTLDGRWIALLAVQPEQWRGLVRALGDDRLADERFLTVAARQANRKEIDGIVAPLIAARVAIDVITALVANGVPASVVNNVADLVTDEHVIARGELVDIDGFTMPGVVPRFVDQPSSVRWPGEMLGASNSYVFGEILGLTAVEIEELQTKGII